MHGNGDEYFLKQSSEQMFLLDGDQIALWSGVGDGFHPAFTLTRVAARRRFEQRCLAVQFGFVDHSKRNMVLA